jgi:hypothetical protein
MPFSRARSRHARVDLRAVAGWRAHRYRPAASRNAREPGRAPPAELLRLAEQGARNIQSGLISGATGIRVNKVPVYRNHRIVGDTRSLVDEVLARSHATYPIQSGRTDAPGVSARGPV